MSKYMGSDFAAHVLTLSIASTASGMMLESGLLSGGVLGRLC